MKVSLPLDSFFSLLISMKLKADADLIMPQKAPLSTKV
jgi:hypothetical protein